MIPDDTPAQLTAEIVSFATRAVASKLLIPDADIASLSALRAEIVKRNAKCDADLTALVAAYDERVAVLKRADEEGVRERGYSRGLAQICTYVCCCGNLRLSPPLPLSYSSVRASVVAPQPNEALLPSAGAKERLARCARMLQLSMSRRSRAPRR